LSARLTTIEHALESALDKDDDGAWITLENYLSALERDVAVLQTAISHTKDESDENDKGGLTQRIDALETSIGNNEGSSLSGRVSTLEGAVNDANSGLAATKKIADDATTAIEKLATVATSGDYKDL